MGNDAYIYRLSLTHTIQVYAWKTAESRIEKDATNVADKELITSEPVRPLRIEDIYANRLFRLCSLGELTVLHSADMKSLYEQVAELAEKGGMSIFLVFFRCILFIGVHRHGYFRCEGT